MLQEIKDYLHFFLSDSHEKQKRNIFFIAALIIISLFILNHFILNNLISDDLIVRFQQSNLLFINNLSPYDDDVQNYLKNVIDDLGLDPDPKAFDLEIALPQLVYYLPLSFFRETKWGISIYTTIVMFSYILAVYLLFRVLKIDYSRFDSLLFFLLSICSLFSLRTILSGETNAITFLIIVAVVHFLQQDKKMIAGILLGFAFFDVVTIPVILIIFLVGLIKTKRSATIIWALISSSLIALAMMIFDRNWLIGWLRNLFLQPHTVPFLTYPEALSLRYEFPPYQLFSIISLLLIIWLVYEVWQNPFNSQNAWLWILGVGSILNYFLIIQNSDISAIFIIIAQTIIISIWRERIPKKYLFILFIVLGLNTLIISAIYFLPVISQKDRVFNLFILVSSIFHLLNLYWLKRWAIIPFDCEKLSWDD